MVSGETDEYSEMVSTLTRQQANYIYRQVEDGGRWNDPQDLDQALLVNKILDEIVTVLIGEKS